MGRSDRLQLYNVECYEEDLSFATRISLYRLAELYGVQLRMLSLISAFYWTTAIFSHEENRKLFLSEVQKGSGGQEEEVTVLSMYILSLCAGSKGDS